MASCKVIAVLIVLICTSSFSMAASSMDWVSVTSDSLEGSRGSGCVMFKGNVVVEGKMVLCSDEFKVTYTESKVIKDVIATGRVKVFKDNKKASGDKAVYSKTDGTITITGSAVLSECQGDVSGESIVFKIDGSGAEILGSGDASDEDSRASVTLISDKKCDEKSDINYIKRVESAADLCREFN